MLATLIRSSSAVTRVAASSVAVGGVAAASKSNPSSCASVKSQLDTIQKDLLYIKAYLDEEAQAKKPKPEAAVWATCTLGPNGKPCEGSPAIGGTGKTVTGQVMVQEREGGGVRIFYRVEGLTPGLHGFHVHEKADFSQGCVSAGPHFNPENKKHGGPNSAERHVGDLGNIAADANGVAAGVLEDKLCALKGPRSILGRSFMVHADPDDLGCGGHKLSSTTGNAGGRVACGAIKKVEA